MLTGGGTSSGEGKTLNGSAGAGIGLEVKGGSAAILAEELIGVDVLGHLSSVSVDVDLGDEILTEPRADDLEDKTEEPRGRDGEEKADAVGVVRLDHLEQKLDGSVVLVLALKAVQIVHEGSLLSVVTHTVY